MRLSYKYRQIRDNDMAFMMKPLRGFADENITNLLLMEPLRGSIYTPNQYFNAGGVSSIIANEYDSDQ